MSVAEFARRVSAYCAIFGGSVTSWGRSRRHNAAVGGVPSSAHLFWIAADVVYDTGTLPAGGPDAARRLGLRLIREKDHDHLQPWEWKP